MQGVKSKKKQLLNQRYRQKICHCRDAMVLILEVFVLIWLNVLSAKDNHWLSMALTNIPLGIWWTARTFSLGKYT